MTYEERIKLEDQIDEKANELKELVSQLEDQRVDFEEDEEYVYYNDVVMETSDLRIYEGSNWNYDDELYVSSIFVEDDKLYFDANWDAYNYKGDNCGDEEMNHLEPEFIVQRYWEESQEKAFVDTLDFFISLLKG